MSSNPIAQIKEHGQSVWLDSLSRKIIQDGRLKQLIDAGIGGITSNPVIFERSITSGNIYDEAIKEHSRNAESAQEVFERIAVEDIRSAADMLAPVYDSNDGQDGYVSIEINPNLARDAVQTVHEARRLWKNIARPNVMIKVPGTPEASEAIQTLIGEGISVNVTLLFAPDAHKVAAEAYINGIRDFIQAGRGSPKRVTSVASFFVSRVDTAVDSMLPKTDPRRGKAGIANAIAVYQQFGKIFDRTRTGGGSFFPLFTTGAKVQRPLWASTSVKDFAYPQTMYVESLVAKDTINTMPENTLQAIFDAPFSVRPITAQSGGNNGKTLFESLAKDDISLKRVTDQLLEEGIRIFAAAYDRLMSVVAERSKMYGEKLRTY